MVTDMCPSRTAASALSLVVCFWVVGLATDACAEEPNAATDSPSRVETPAEPDDMSPAVTPPSLARRALDWRGVTGFQAWGDIAWLQGYRMQRHAIEGTYRVLSPKREVLAQGDRTGCETFFHELREKHSLQPMRGEVVLLLHGIVRTSWSMVRLERGMTERGHTVASLDYPGTWIGIPECAAYLQEVIASMPEVERFHFATHSMGGLVVRSYLSTSDDTRHGRLVMLGTPNKGAELATMLRSFPPFRWTLGPAGQQLAHAPGAFVHTLPAVPNIEFGILVGGSRSGGGFNPLLEGDDDGTVSVASSRLAGATDFTKVKSMHALLPGQQDSIDAVDRFLRTGAFRESGVRQPIPLAE
jgi:pimeloyl-ACP methyl ester carboxylesterase